MKTEEDNQRQPIISCRQLVKIYQQGQVQVNALQGVDLDIDEGDFVSLAGASGCGKTTLLNMMGGLDRSTQGQVLLQGQSLSTMSTSALATLRMQKIGFVFQAYNLIPVLTAEENVAFIMQLQQVPKAERRQRAREILDAVGLEGMYDRKPGELSGGQQQRVAVARAMVTKPLVVLADEPTANLDSESSAQLLALMRTLNETYQRTFVVATHDPEVIAFTRRRITLKDGRIINDERE